VTALDKDDRKEIHQILKNFSKVDSNNEDKDGKKLIKVKGALKSQKKQWPVKDPSIST
jgi:predicted RNA-binding protein Jag